MAAKFVVFFACVALAAGMVRRETSTAFDDFTKNAESIKKTFSEGLESAFNSKNTQDVNKALKEGTDTFLKSVSDFSKSMQQLIGDANSKTKEAWEKSQADIHKATEELRKAHPEVETNAQKVREELQKTLDAALKGSQNIAKEFATNFEETSKKLTPQAKAVYDDLVKQAEEVQKKLHEAAKKQ